MFAKKLILPLIDSLVTFQKKVYRVAKCSLGFGSQWIKVGDHGLHEKGTSFFEDRNRRTPGPPVATGGPAAFGTTEISRQRRRDTDRYSAEKFLGARVAGRMYRRTDGDGENDDIQKNCGHGGKERERASADGGGWRRRVEIRDGVYGKLKGKQYTRYGVA